MHRFDPLTQACVICGMPRTQQYRPRRFPWSVINALYHLLFWWAPRKTPSVQWDTKPHLSNEQKRELLVGKPIPHWARRGLTETIFEAKAQQFWHPGDNLFVANGTAFSTEYERSEGVAIEYVNPDNSGVVRYRLWEDVAITRDELYETLRKLPRFSDGRPGGLLG